MGEARLAALKLGLSDIRHALQGCSTGTAFVSSMIDTVDALSAMAQQMDSWRREGHRG